MVRLLEGNGSHIIKDMDVVALSTNSYDMLGPTMQEKINGFSASLSLWLCAAAVSHVCCFEKCRLACSDQASPPTPEEQNVPLENEFDGVDGIDSRNINRMLLRRWNMPPGVELSTGQSLIKFMERGVPRLAQGWLLGSRQSLHTLLLPDAREAALGGGTTSSSNGRERVLCVRVWVTPFRSKQMTRQQPATASRAAAHLAYGCRPHNFGG